MDASLHQTHNLRTNRVRGARLCVPSALAVRHFDWQTNVGARECRGKMGREQKPQRQSQYFISTPEEGLVV